MDPTPTLEVQKPLCSAGLYKKLYSKCFDIIKNYIKEEKMTIRKYYDMKTLNLFHFCCDYFLRY